MSRAALAVVAATVTAAFGGCGGDDDQSHDPRIAIPIRTFVRSLPPSGAPRACSALAPDAREDLVRLAQSGIPQTPPDCEVALDTLARVGSLDFVRAGVMDLDQAQRGLHVEVEVVDRAGDSATARVNRSEKTVPLVRDGNHWLIAQLDFSDVPR